MGYNGGNRHMRSSMFSKRATKQGSKMIGDLFTGILGAGVVVGKEIGKAIEDNANNAKIKQEPKQKAKQTMQDTNENEKESALEKWIGIIAFGIIAALVMAFAWPLAVFLLLPLGLLSKR